MMQNEDGKNYSFEDEDEVEKKLSAVFEMQYEL